MSDISELMNRDPLELTKDDLKEIVQFYRKQRHLFKNNISPAAKKTTPKTPSAKAAAKLDIGDLEL